jgi:hypothetical protein
MRFDSIDYLKEIGFVGFRSIKDLTTNSTDISDESGVYLVLYLSGERPDFVPTGVGGFYKENDPNMSIAELESRWVEDTVVIYIGQTGNSLRRRITQYMRFGQGNSVGHYGGRYIWQIRGYQKLVLCWLACSGEEDAKQMEGEVLREFKGIYGRLPFANLRE